jgi:hypothetical protein
VQADPMLQASQSFNPPGGAMNFPGDHNHNGRGLGLQRWFLHGWCHIPAEEPLPPIWQYLDLRCNKRQSAHPTGRTNSTSSPA